MDFQWAKKAIRKAQERIDAVLDIATDEDEANVLNALTISASSKFDAVLEDDEDTAKEDEGWEIERDVDTSNWEEQSSKELASVSTAVPVVDAEPNPIRDSHTDGLYQHSPTSNSPDEGCSGDDHDHDGAASSTTSEKKDEVSLGELFQEQTPLSLPNSSSELTLEENSSVTVATSCDDALTVVSSDIEVLRQGDSCSIGSSVLPKNIDACVPDHISTGNSLQVCKEGSSMSLETMAAEIAQLKVQMQYQERRNRDLQARNQKLERKSQDFVSLKAAVAQHSTTEAMLIKKLSEKEGELAALLQEGEKLAETNGKLSKELKRLKKSHAEQEQLAKKGSQMEIDRDLAKEEVRGLTAENTKLRATIRSLEEDALKVRTTEEILNAEIRRKDEKVERLTADVQRAEVGRESALDEMKRLESLMQELSSKADERELSSKGIEEITKGLNAAVEEERRKNERQTCYIDSLEKRLADMMETQRNTAEMVAMANQPLLATIHQLEDEMASKENSHEMVIRENERALSQLSVEKDDLLHQNKELSAELSKLRAANNDSQRSTVELCTKLRQAENECRRLEAEDERWRRVIDGVKSSLQAKEEEVEKLYSRLRTEAENAEKLSNEKQQRINFLTSKCEDHEKEIAVLRENADAMSSRKVSRTASTTSIPVDAEKMGPLTHASIGAAQSELIEVMNKYEQAMRHISSLQAKLTEMEGNTRILFNTRKELQDLRMRYESLLEAHGEKIEKVEELQLDLADVKKLFRDQMELLLGKG